MEKLAVIGCGTMGHSIALNAAWAGIPVVIQGIDNADTARAWQGIEEKLQLLLLHGLLQEKESILAKIRLTKKQEEAVAEASFVIEAIPENIEAKQLLFRELDSLCPQEVVLASNTSGLSPSAIASAMRYPERSLVTHFWNPAHLIPLVEVVRNKNTTDATFHRAMQLMLAMQKKPIEVKKEIPGFVVNRLQYALFREAQYLLQEGVATLEDIDLAVESSIGRRLPVTGPFATADMGGLDVFSAISDYLFQQLSKADGSLPVLQQLVQEKKYGSKTGTGYYEWSPAFSKKMNEQREALLIHFLKQDLEKKSTAP